MSTSFTVHDTVHWSATSNADVIELRVDGELLPSDQWLDIVETYPSYDVAKREFVPRTLELVTTSRTLTKLVELGHCDDLPGTECPEGRACGEPLTLESAHFQLRGSFDGGASFLDAYQGTCEWANAVGAGWTD